jgi:hypothetical protein
MSKLILELGGDVSFETVWNKDYNPGSGTRRGNALDFANDMKGRCNNPNGLINLINMMAGHVSELHGLVLLQWASLNANKVNEVKLSYNEQLGAGRLV